MLIIGLSLLVGRGEASVVDHLRARDGAICVELGPAVPSLRDELAALSVADVSPSYVPMRAAGCLMELFAEDPALPGIVAPWLQDTELGGLGLLVLEGAEKLPVASEVELAKIAVASTDPRWGPKFRDRVARSSRPEVRSVLDGAGVPR